MKYFYAVINISFLTLVSSTSLDPGCMLKDIIPSDERIRAHGYPAESHFVETEDGYILNLFRIPFSPKVQKRKETQPVVFLQHGLFSNSDSFLAGGPDDSLAYNLVDAGYDVWLGNARGNIYSRENTKISLNSPRFWAFDWHDIGVIDLPTMIDYIIEETSQDKIHYAGHSQGTTVYFVLLSELPEYNEKIKSAHMLAPCAFFQHGRSEVFNVFRPLVGKPGGLWNQLLSNIEIMPQNSWVAKVSNTACGPDPALKVVCKNLWLLFAGDGYVNTNVTALQDLLATHPGGASSNQGIHYIQLTDANLGRFCQMDYGAKRNKKIYGRETPPDYNLENIVAATYLYSSTNDALCDPKDVDTLVAKMPFLSEDYRIPDETWSHLDFIIGNDMKEMVNDRVLENMSKHEYSIKLTLSKYQIPTDSSSKKNL